MRTSTLLTLIFHRGVCDAFPFFHERHLAERGWPDLILSVNVIEHLRNPGGFLGVVRNEMGRTTIGPQLLIVTENLRYYDKCSLDSADGVAIAAPAKVPILSLGRDHLVDVSVHTRTKLAMTFRNEGFLVTQEALLSFPRGGDTRVREAYAASTDNVNWGIPPFRAMLLKPLPKAERTHSIPNAFAGSPTGILLRQELKKGGYAELMDQAEVISLRPGELLISRHNFGGNLFIVLEGWVGLDDGATSFVPFDLLGELEAHTGNSGPQPPYGVYIDNAVAGATGAKVLVIPEALASPLFSPDAGLVGSLFANLRIKLLQRNLRQTNRRNSDQSFSKSKQDNLTSFGIRANTYSPKAQNIEAPAELSDAVKQLLSLPPDPKAPSEAPRRNAITAPIDRDISRYGLGRVAGTLLFLLMNEQDQGKREGKANMVFVDFPRLVKLCDITDAFAKQVMSDHFRLLIALGSIDAMPLSALRRLSGANAQSVRFVPGDGAGR